MARLLCAIAALLVLAGCSLERFIPDDVEVFVAETESFLLTGDRDGLRAVMTPEASTAVSDELLSEVLALFSDVGELKSAGWINYAAQNMTSTSGSTNVTETLREVVFEDTAFVVRQRLTRTADGLRVLYINVNQLTPEQIANEAFPILGKSPVHYIVLALLVALPLFSIATIVAVWRTRHLKRPVLWTLFCLVGFGALSFDWLTGAFSTTLLERSASGLSFNLFQFQVLSAALWKEPYGPWTLVLSFPLGAALFWLQKARNSLRLKAPPTEATPTAAS
jgi:hypothetical protein